MRADSKGAAAKIREGGRRAQVAAQEEVYLLSRASFNVYAPCLRLLLFSNRPFGVKRFQTIHHYSVDVARGLALLLQSAIWGQALSDYPPLQCRCRSRARASLRNRHRGPSSMGFEDEVEQSLRRPCRQTDGRSKTDLVFTISLKRSTPKSSAIHKLAGRLPHLREEPGSARRQSCSPATRPGASPPTSPNCRSCCANRNTVSARSMLLFYAAPSIKIMLRAEKPAC